VLNEEPRRVYGLVSQFVDEPSPYYAPLLTARQDHVDAEKVGEALKAILTQPDPPKPKSPKAKSSKSSKRKPEDE
jgi:hypothetical protein